MLSFSEVSQSWPCYCPVPEDSFLMYFVKLYGPVTGQVCFHLLFLSSHSEDIEKARTGCPKSAYIKLKMLCYMLSYFLTWSEAECITKLVP